MTFARDFTQEVQRMRLSERILISFATYIGDINISLALCVYMCVVSREANQRGTINFVCFQ